MFKKFLVFVAVGFLFPIQYVAAQDNLVAPENLKLNAINLTWPLENLLVGGQPSKMDLETIRKLGFSTIITLRPIEEERHANIGYDEAVVAEKMGFQFVRIPILDSTDLTDENLQKLDKALMASTGKAFVHCRTGNRVGAMLALRAFRMQNLSYDQSLDLGIRAGLNTMQADVETAMKGKPKSVADQ